MALPAFLQDWQEWAVAGGIAVVVTIALWLVKSFLVTRLARVAQYTATRLDDVLVQLLDKTRLPFFLAVGLYAGMQSTRLPEKAHAVLHNAFVFVLFLQLGFWSTHAITYLTEAYVRRTGDPGKTTTMRALALLGKIVVWSIVVLLLLSNWGINVSALVTGLGIGGVAVALAVQNILGDLLASLSIVFDKPFVVGDFIVVGTEMGTVEHIGLKTTRLKSLTGEQLIVSNSDLLKSRIKNYKRMQERRVYFKIGVLYETPLDKLTRAREIVRSVIESVPGTRFTRCNLFNFGDSSIELEIEYWVLSPEHGDYVERHHTICLGLIDAFRREGLEFAYPTRKLFLEQVKS